MMDVSIAQILEEMQYLWEADPPGGLQICCGATNPLFVGSSKLFRIASQVEFFTSLNMYPMVRCI